VEARTELESCACIHISAAGSRTLTIEADEDDFDEDLGSAPPQPVAPPIPVRSLLSAPVRCPGIGVVKKDPALFGVIQNA